MAVTFLPKIGVSQAAKGDEPGNWITLWNQDNARIEERLATTFAGDPNTNVEGFYIGQQCYDTVSKKIFICTTIGNPATAVWEDFIVIHGLDFYSLAPSGTILVWDQLESAIPAGWAKITGIDGKVLGLVENEAGIETLHGANNVVPTMQGAGGHSHGGSTGSTSLTVANIPALSVLFSSLFRLSGRSHGVGPDQTYMSNAGTTQTATTGGSGTGHTHPITTEGDHTHIVDSVDNRPATINYMLIQKS